MQQHLGKIRGNFAQHKKHANKMNEWENKLWKRLMLFSIRMYALQRKEYINTIRLDVGAKFACRNARNVGTLFYAKNLWKFLRRSATSMHSNHFALKISISPLSPFIHLVPRKRRQKKTISNTRAMKYPFRWNSLLFYDYFIEILIFTNGDGKGKY